MFKARAALFLLGVAMVAAESSGDQGTTQKARELVSQLEHRLRPLEVEASRAWWQANISGKDEDFARKQEVENRLNELLSNSDNFKQLKQLHESDSIDDRLMRRAIDVLYLTYLEKQVDRELLKRIVALSNGLEQSFNAFRAQVDGKSLTHNDVRKVLEESTSSDQRRKVWLASKEVGARIAPDLLALVKLRNQAARSLGFANYHALQLFVNEQDSDKLLGLFDELDRLTADQFREAKQQLDTRLAENVGIKPADLMPWHYHDPFFQETPKVFSSDPNAPYKNADIVGITRAFYAGIGLPVEDVIERSDLYERPGKSPHAFCTDIDRHGDVRVLANIVQNADWMSTMLHEFGHAVYSSKNIPATVPYTLRKESHILTTEGVAMLFERVAGNPIWLKKMGLPAPAKEDEGDLQKKPSYGLLIFSRWCQVMLRFEKSMYENPDQDLGKLWWDLVEKYQQVRRPVGRDAPDYASKIHIVSAPVYYHNYMMGQLFASQLHHAIARELASGTKPRDVIYAGDPRIGKFMKQRVFEPGKTLGWNELTQYATGAELSAKSFAEDLKQTE